MPDTEPFAANINSDETDNPDGRKKRRTENVIIN